MPKCLILIGPPCAGKSTWCDDQPYISISRDEIREELYGHTRYKEMDENEVSRRFWSLFDSCTRVGKLDIVMDNCHLRMKYIKETVEKLPGDYTVEFKLFPVSYPKAFYRNIIRWAFTGKWIPLKYVKQCINNYKKITENGQYLVYERHTLPS